MRAAATTSLLLLAAACSRDALSGDEGTRDAAMQGGHFRFDSSAKRYIGGLAPFALVARNLDEDGLADVVLGITELGVEQGRLVVVAGQGDGDLRAAWTTPFHRIATSWRPALAIADLDGDSRPDLLSFRGPLRNDGGGRFDELEELPVWLGRFALADVDGDGRLDIVHDLHEAQPQGAGVEVLVNRTPTR